MGAHERGMSGAVLCAAARSCAAALAKIQGGTGSLLPGKVASQEIARLKAQNVRSVMMMMMMMM
eukprot:COSAG02_NODE_59613_length_274_cov_0.291429_1_plen_63_part_10